MCVYYCAQLLYVTQQRTILIIFPLILQIMTIAQTMSIAAHKILRSKMVHFKSLSEGTDRLID